MPPERHRAKAFLAFLRQIDRTTDPDLDLHIILDNSSNHRTPAVNDSKASAKTELLNDRAAPNASGDHGLQ